MPFGVTFSGPIFAHSPSEATQQSVKRGMDKLAQYGQGLVQAQLVPGHGVRTGYFRRSVRGTVIGWSQLEIGSPVIYGSWLEEGPHGRQPPGIFTGYHMFSMAKEHLERGDAANLLGSGVVGYLNG